MRPIVTIGAGAFALALASPAAAEAISDVQDLASLSIEQLAQIPVQSASKTSEPLSSAPTALYVITGNDIISSGAITLPEALRLAPNLNVQQITATDYSISARGFNGAQAGNKLLVQIDGRSIYTPLASSVFYNLHYPLLEDIQQIEVISGPGGTLYGPNAVNGVVSITTADAQDTIGTLVRGTVGAQERTAAIRHGFAIGTSGAMRVYADYYGTDGLPAGDRPNLNDSYRALQGGFRSDFGGASDHVTLQGDIFKTYSDVIEGDSANGHNLLGRYSRTLSPNSSFQIQTYYDYFVRHFQLVDDSVQTFDGQAQFNLTSGRHNIVAGGGIRTTHDLFVNGLNAFHLVPDSERLWVYNLFAQDRFSITPTVDVIAGVKVERSSFTGWQVLPNLRLAWQPDKHNLLWAAVSRAVRTPSRIDSDLEALPILAQNPDFQSEKLIAFEAGYRGQPSQSSPSRSPASSIDMMI